MAEIRLPRLTHASASFNLLVTFFFFFCLAAPCKCSLIAQRAELCTSMKNYQQALHDADVLCRNKPHWPAVRRLHAAENKMLVLRASLRGGVGTAEVVGGASWPYQGWKCTESEALHRMSQWKVLSVGFL